MQSRPLSREYPQANPKSPALPPSQHALGRTVPLIITGTPKGISTVSFGKTTIFVADKHTALSFWNVYVPAPNAIIYDRAPDVPSVFVFGPYLVRNATLANGESALALHGDINTTTTLDIVAPSSVKSATWNGQVVQVQKSDIGTLRGTLGFGAKAPTLPNLKTVEWLCADSPPEIQNDFDDKSWVAANKTSTARPYQPLAGKVSVRVDIVHEHLNNEVDFSMYCTQTSMTSTRVCELQQETTLSAINEPRYLL